MDVTPELARVRCPVLVLHRQDASVVALEVSEALVAGLPDALLRVLPGDSASLFFEQTDDVVAELVEFVTGRSRATRATSQRGTGGTAAARLTQREIEVVGLIAAGESNLEIAARLGVTENTVERHVTNVYRKIDARGRADATAWAIRNGIA